MMDRQQVGQVVQLDRQNAIASFLKEVKTL